MFYRKEFYRENFRESRRESRRMNRRLDGIDQGMQTLGNAQESLVEDSKELHRDVHGIRSDVQSQLVTMMQAAQNHHQQLMWTLILGIGFLSVTIIVGFVVATYFG